MTICAIKSNNAYYDYMSMQPVGFGTANLLKWFTSDFDLVNSWTDRSIYMQDTYIAGTGCARASVHPSGFYGDAFSFNGTSTGNIKFPSISLPGEFTVCFWFNRVVDASHGITGNSTETGLYSSKIAISAGGPIKVRAIQGLESPQASISIGLGSNTNKWDFITVIRDVSNVVSASLNNGAFVSSPTLVPGTYVTDVFGTNSDLQHFKGIIGEMMIYDRTLSQTEKDTNYINSPFYHIKLGI